MEITDLVKIGIKETDVVKAIESFDSRIANLRRTIQNTNILESLKARGEEHLVACLMDLLEDTQLAVKAYRQVPDETKDPHDGFAYLYIYGLMQALTLQHDALMKLISVSKLDFDLIDEYPQLHEVRDYRVRIAGHPVTKGEDGNPQMNFLVRGFLDHKSFSIETLENGKAIVERTSINALLYCQMSNCSKALERIVQSLTTSINV